MNQGILLATFGMIAAVAASNYLVELPINEFLTWGSFSYPVTFFITETVNYFHGPRWARRVVYIGFLVAVTLSFLFMNPQIAMASGLAFLIGQLLDISVFTRLRRMQWWLAPASASIAGSFVDTVIFFTIAFWGQGFLIVTLGTGDFLIKLSMDLVMLLPFRLFLWRSPINHRPRITSAIS